MGLPAPGVSVVTVAPTSTLVLELDVRTDQWLTVQVDNVDGSQTFVGAIERRVSEAMQWSPSTIGDFAGIGPGDSVTADLDVTGTGFIRLVGYMSGAGGDVHVCARKGQRK
jgi:hypothetical protein